MSTFIHLQSFGKTPAKAAGDFKIGDITVWNFGITAEVVGFGKETKAFIELTLKDAQCGLYNRKLKKDRLVGISL